MKSDLKLKLISLVLAIMVWFHAVTEKVYISHVSIPIIYKNIPKNMVLIHNPPTACDLVIKGKGKMLLLFNLRKPHVTVDLSDKTAGVNIIKIALPHYRDIEVLAYSPQKIKIYLDRKGKKKVKVKPAITGTPHEELALSSVEVDPDIVLLEGPSTMISKIKAVSTEEIDISGEDKSFARVVRVVVPGDTEGLMKTEPSMVKITVTFEPKELDSVKVPVKVKSVKWRVFKVKPREVTLIYRVPSSRKNIVKKKTFSAWVTVDTTAQKGKILYLPVRYNAPPEVTIVGAKPPNVEVIVRR